MTPRVSIVIPAYNEGEHIRPVLDHVFEQVQLACEEGHTLGARIGLPFGNLLQAARGGGARVHHVCRIGQVRRQRWNRRRANHAQDLWDFVLNPFVVNLINAAQQTDERFDCSLCAQLAECAPGVDWRPGFQAFHIGGEQVIIHRHAYEIWDMFQAQAKFKVIGPFE